MSHNNGYEPVINDIEASDQCIYSKKDAPLKKSNFTIILNLLIILTLIFSFNYYFGYIKY